jgi:hypothetical protein
MAASFHRAANPGLPKTQGPGAGRPANLVDLLLMRTREDALQGSTWRETVVRVVERSGGQGSEVQEDERALDRREAGGVEEWLTGLIRGRDGRP